MPAIPESQQPDQAELSTDALPRPAEDSILNIIGIGESEQESDIARYKREYIADAIESKCEP
jgi:hypothetical protein